MTKIILIIAGILGCTSLLHAQTTLKGKVLDQHGKPLSDISVSMGSNITKTDGDGFFRLFVIQNDGSKLLLKAVGYEKLVAALVPQGSEMEIGVFTLRKTNHTIDQVDVTGYNSVNDKTVGVAKSGIQDKYLPQSVQIINKQVISDQQVNTLGDALKNANGIALGANRGAVNENFFARGYSLGANNIFKNSARTNNGGQIEASTLESVEVLKGAAALLYGGVTGGAVVNLVTKKPKFELGGEVAMRYGSWDRYKPTLDLYGPLSDKVAFRIIGTGESANSFRDKVTSNRVYVNPSILYKLSDRTEFNVNFDYLKADFTPDFGIGSVEGKLNDAVGRNAFLNVNGAFNRTNSINGQASLDHNFNANWKLSTIASIQNYHRNYYGSDRLQANKDGLAPRALSRSLTEEFTRNQQINLTGAFRTGGLQHQLLFGADADQSANNAYAYAIYANRNNPSKPSTAYDVIDVFNPYKEGMRQDVPEMYKSIRTRTDVYRYGAFIQDMVSISDKFKALVGVRYTYQRTPYSQKYDYATQKLTDQVIKDINGVELGAKEDKAWSPKFGLIYTPLLSTTIYASYANSFTSNSGYDVNFKPLAPSLIDHFEVGVKNDFFHDRLSANLTWYRINNNKFAQMAVLGANGDANGDTNMKEFTGKTASDGIELDITGRLLPGLDLMAGYAYNYMRYTETLGIMAYTNNKGENLETSGNQENMRLIGTTAHTGNATLFYTLQEGAIKGLKLGASVFYTGKRNAGWNNSKINVRDGVNRLIPVDPFTTIDLSVGYSFGKLSLLAKLANITDELSYFVHENYSVNPIPPRNFMTTARYSF